MIEGPVTVEKFIHSVSLAWKQLWIYPEGHPARAGAVERAFSMLKVLVAPTGSLTFGVDREALICAGDRLTDTNAQQLAGQLFRRNVAVVRFEEGVTAPDLEHWLALLHPDPLMQQSSRLWDQAAAAGVRHIVMEAVDFSGVEASDDLDTVVEKPEAEATPRTLWQRILHNLMEEGRQLQSSASGASGGSDGGGLAQVVQLLRGLITEGDEGAEGSGAFVASGATAEGMSPQDVAKARRGRMSHLSEQLAAAVAGHLQTSGGEVKGSDLRQVAELVKALPAILQQDGSIRPRAERVLVARDGSTAVGRGVRAICHVCLQEGSGPDGVGVPSVQSAQTSRTARAARTPAPGDDGFGDVRPSGSRRSGVTGRGIVMVVQWSDGGRGEVNVVRTTKIYCRAGCAGRPLPSNCARLRSPAEAEAAGYRACLRCRSDRLPLVSTAPGSDPIVARALVLIGDGFLDRHDEAALGREVGASARHLRRMFSDVVGATPSQIAASRRAHFARSLLDETDLTVTEIAFASGFGSVRRMNEVVRSVFRASPSELRGRRGHPDGSAVDGGLRVTLHAHRPIDVDTWRTMIVDSLLPGVESFDGEVFRRSTHVCGHAGVVEIEVCTPHRADVTLHLASSVAAIDEVGRCRRLLGLDRIDGAVSRAWTPFEGAVRDAFGDRTDELITLACLAGAPVSGAADLGVDREFPAPHEVLGAADRLGAALPDGLTRLLHALATEHLDRPQ